MDSRREDSQFTHRDKSRSTTDYAHIIRNNLRFVNKKSSLLAVVISYHRSTFKKERRNRNLIRI